MNLRVNNRIVGEYVEKFKTLYKYVDSTKHFFYSGKGYAISDSAIEQLKALGCETVRLKLTNKKSEIWETEFANFLSPDAIKIDFGDKQTVVNEKLWIKEIDGEVDTAEYFIREGGEEVKQNKLI